MSIGHTTTSIRPNILQLMLQNSSDAQYIADVERDVFLKSNPALFKLSGYSEEEIINEGFHYLDLIHPEDRPTLLEVHESKDVDQEAHQRRFRILRKDGEVRHVDAQLRKVRYMGRQVVIASLRDITDRLALETRLKGKSETTQTKVHKSNQVMLQMASANNRLYQMVESLKAVPELSKQLSALDNSNEVIKQACLYITNQESGLQFGSCIIYLRREEQLEVAYANPFRATTMISINESAAFAKILSGEVDLIVTEEGNRVVPIHDREGIIGILEVGIGRTLERIFAQDDPVRRAQENVIKAIADFIGGQIANIKLREKIQQQVVEDKLTGLFNRRHFDEKIEAEFKRAARYNRSLSLIVLDIDHFKQVNDVHGHAQGDSVLSAIGGMMGKNFRDLDTVCRTGGEEFAILMPETSTEAAFAKAEQLRSEIAALEVDMTNSKVPHEPDEKMRVTVSLGISSFSPAIESADHLYQTADRMLYIAKDSGRNRVISA